MAFNVQDKQARGQLRAGPDTDRRGRAPGGAPWIALWWPAQGSSRPAMTTLSVRPPLGIACLPSNDAGGAEVTPKAIQKTP